MERPSTPPDEEARLAELRALRVLDTAPEERFDWITRVARRLFDVPISVIALVDGQRTWFKSRQGIAIREIPREVSFCGHVILGTEALVVPDASDDPRFADSPLVTGEPRVRFYAGYPLRAPDGSRIGALSIADTRSRRLSEDEARLLGDLARIVENELVVVPLNDALERRDRAEEELRALNAALENAVEGISRLDVRGRYVFANRAVVHMLAIRPVDLMGLEWQRTVHPEDVPDVTAAYQRMLAMGKAEVEARVLRRNGSSFHAQMVLVAARNGLGRFAGHYCFLKDITERKLAEEEMRRLATTDGLTGLYNRHYLMGRIAEELARGRRYGSITCVLMIDLDRFKEVNDAHGHEAGDTVLARVGGLIRGRLRAADIAARYGGEEFCVLVTQTPLEKARQLAEELRERIAEEAFTSPRGEPLRVTCSIGVAELDGGRRDVAGVMRLADAALYQAKAAGRNRVVLYQP